MRNDRKQVSAPMTQFMGEDAFRDQGNTRIYWLGSGGIFINSHGTLLMVDPVLENDPQDSKKSEAGYRYLVPPPVASKSILHLDAILYTHADYDHMGPASAKALLHTGAKYEGTAFSGLKLSEFGIPKERIYTRKIGETYQLGSIQVTLTPASHSWQKDRPEFDWYYGPEDCCGFYLEMEEGNLWIPGDSVLMQEHLNMKDVDAMFLDVSKDPFHFGPEAAIQLANTYLEAELLLYHYGTYDAPEKLAFNGDPAVLNGRLLNAERLHVLAPGEAYFLS